MDTCFSLLRFCAFDAGVDGGCCFCGWVACGVGFWLVSSVITVNSVVRFRFRLRVLVVCV